MRPHIYKRPCPSVRRLKNGLIQIQNDLDSAGRGKKRDEEEGGMRRKEGRGGRREEESEKMKKLLKEMKKSLKDASLASLCLVFCQAFPD